MFLILFFVIISTNMPISLHKYTLYLQSIQPALLDQSNVWIVRVSMWHSWASDVSANPQLDIHQWSNRWSRHELSFDSPHFGRTAPPLPLGWLTRIVTSYVNSTIIFLIYLCFKTKHNTNQLFQGNVQFAGILAAPSCIGCLQ